MGDTKFTPGEDRTYEIYCTKFSKIIHAGSLYEAVKLFGITEPNETIIFAEDTVYASENRNSEAGASFRESLEGKEGGARWRNADDKPTELLKSYYCKVYLNLFEKYVKRMVLITLDGQWQDNVVEWLDESPMQSEGAGWVSGNVPQDGTKIIRWHKLWKCPIAVTYDNKNHYAEFKWVEVTRSHTWPEEAFTNHWMPLPPAPLTEK